jgi:hypothetical protein
MKFPYKKSTNRLNLIILLLWTALTIADIALDNMRWITVFKAVLAVFYAYQYFYGKQKGYFEITDKSIKIYQLPQKEIALKDLVEIEKKFDEYYFKSKEQTIKISNQSLDKNYKELLNKKVEEIKELCLPVA